MGSSYSLTPDSESAVDGKKCVLSSELEDCSYDDFIEGIRDILKRPVPPFQEPAVKAVEVTEQDENTYTAKVILDGAKLEGFGYGDGTGKDKVSNWMKVTFKPAEGILMTETYVNPANPKLPTVEEATTDKVYLTSMSRVLKDPLRMEYWWELENGERMYGQEQADHVKPYMDGTIALAKKKKVSFAPDCDSLAEPGSKSAISTPIDDFITVDGLWAQLLDFANIYKDLEIIEISDTEIAVTGPGGVEPPTGVKAVQWDKEKGTLVTTTKIAGKVQGVLNLVVHQEPLRVEAWRVEASGERVSSKMYAKQSAYWLDEVIQRHEKASSWFG
mmetsp:Transcript_116965/g.364139  ORF Transcript_116965/g.364139 Transcript_116965/m.364139 type:complete len:330 (+) Transcript_116965:68-1057(+)